MADATAVCLCCVHCWGPLLMDFDCFIMEGLSLILGVRRNPFCSDPISQLLIIIGHTSHSPDCTENETVASPKWFLAEVGFCSLSFGIYLIDVLQWWHIVWFYVGRASVSSRRNEVTVDERMKWWTGRNEDEVKIILKVISEVVEHREINSESEVKGFPNEATRSKI